MTREDWKIFLDSAEDTLTNDERAAAIADVLEAGNPSRLFCQMLAGMIRPSGRNASNYRMKMQRKANGRPGGRLALMSVGDEMERLVDGEGKAVDAAVAIIQRRFGRRGNGKRKCEMALREARHDSDMCRLLDRWTAELKAQKTN